MQLLDNLRNILEGNGRSQRNAVRHSVKQATETAREEIKKSRELRELYTLERQYGVRVRGKGKHGSSRSRA